jgi:hypothetical protein
VMCMLNLRWVVRVVEVGQILKWDVGDRGNEE